MVGKVLQSDWGSGMWRSGGRDRVPENASGELQEFYLGDDGLPYQRGGAVRKSTAAAGTGGVQWVVDAALRAGQRTVFGTPSGLYTLDSNDASPFPIATSPPGWSAPVRSVVIDGILYVEPGSSGLEVEYGGSRKVNYSTGTLDVTNGSAVVVGHGTLWLANLEAGMFINVSGTVASIWSVDSNTQLTLRGEWLGGTSAGAGYFGSSVAVFAVSNPAPVLYGSVANRVVRTNGPRTMEFSPVRTHGAWDPNDQHLFPAAQLGYGTLRDVLFVFTTGGVWAVSGMAYPLIDAVGNPQHRQELVNGDLVLWSHEGIAAWGGGLVVPALDGVWLMDSVSAPTRISRPVDDLYLSYVRAGHHCGLAEVFDGHYKVPILSSGNAWVDTLVCKFVATRTGPGFVWSRLRGTDAQVSSFAERSTSPPLLLAGSLAASSRVLDCTGFFAPAGAVKNDADGSGRQSVWESREFSPQDTPTSFRRVRVWYELSDAASDNPTVEFSWARDTDTSWTVVANSLGTVQGSGAQAGGVSDGTKYHQWPVNKTAKGMRFRVRTVGPSAGFKLRGVELVTEGSGNV